MAENNGNGNGKRKRLPDYELLAKFGGRYINLGAAWAIEPKDGDDEDAPTRYSVRLKLDQFPNGFDGSLLMSPPRR